MPWYHGRGVDQGVWQRCVQGSGVAHSVRSGCEAVAEVSERIDIGGGHSICFVEYKGDSRAGLTDYHQRPDGGGLCSGFITFESSAWAKEFTTPIPTWKVESWEPLTLSPSLLCRSCGDHGFIRQGKWVKA